MTPLFDRVLQTEGLPSLRAVLVGGSEDVVRKGAAAINRASQSFKIVEIMEGYRPLKQYGEFLDHQGFDMILVAMGSPRSEEFILEASAHFSGKLFWNIGGGTLNFHAGTLRPVPSLVSKFCLQWVWRMACEPHLVPRYALGIPVFVKNVLQTCPKETKKRECLC